MGLASKMLVIVLASILILTGFTVTFGLIRGSIKPADFVNRIGNLFSPDYYMIFLVIVAILVVVSFSFFLIKQHFQI